MPHTDSGWHEKSTGRGGGGKSSGDDPRHWLPTPIAGACSKPILLRRDSSRGVSSSAIHRDPRYHGSLSSRFIEGFMGYSEGLVALTAEAKAQLFSCHEAERVASFASRESERGENDKFDVSIFCEIFLRRSRSGDRFPQEDSHLFHRVSSLFLASLHFEKTRKSGEKRKTEEERSERFQLPIAAEGSSPRRARIGRLPRRERKDPLTRRDARAHFAENNRRGCKVAKLKRNTEKRKFNLPVYKDSLSLSLARGRARARKEEDAGERERERADFAGFGSSRSLRFERASAERKSA